MGQSLVTFWNLLHYTDRWPVRHVENTYTTKHLISRSSFQTWNTEMSFKYMVSLICNSVQKPPETVNGFDTIHFEHVESLHVFHSWRIWDFILNTQTGTIPFLLTQSGSNILIGLLIYIIHHFRLNLKF